MDLHLPGKTAVVTGASKGIGFAITKAFVEAGAHVIGGARTCSEGLSALQATGQVSFVQVDLSQPGSAEELGVVRPTRAALPEFERRGGGSIVIVGSISAYLPGPETYNYCAAKAAVTNIAKALSKELAPNNIRVNSVSPGAVSTRRWMEQGGPADGFAAANGQTPDEVRAELANAAPTGRVTTPEQVADLVVFLASDRAGNTTGSDYRVDGGYVTTL